MNLAALKYRSVLSKDGGPISVLSARPNVQEDSFISFAWLAPNSRPAWLATPVIYGGADGCGTDKLQSAAAYKAISEALERWAFYEIACSSSGSHYGFDVDCSTSGMAAFPGWSSKQARTNAWYEAVERWSVCSWWEGRLKITEYPSSCAGIRIHRIEPLWQGAETVILHKKSSLHSKHCYAFATAANIKKACERAAIELNRNCEALDKHIQILSDGRGHEMAPDDVYERRLIYFSEAEGFEHFEKKIKSPPLAGARLPYLSNDSEIRGGWSRYATVWRCMFEPISLVAFGNDQDYFLF